MFRIKYCREIVLKVLFQLDINKVKPEQLEEETVFFLKSVKGLQTEEYEFILRMSRLVQEQKEDIDRLITKTLIDWKIERLNVVDRSLLRLGIAESIRPDHPDKAVIIDDVVRIAKKYSESDSYKIINAMLDNVIA